MRKTSTNLLSLFHPAAPDFQILRQLLQKVFRFHPKGNSEALQRLCICLYGVLIDHWGCGAGPGSYDSGVCSSCVLTRRKVTWVGLTLLSTCFRLGALIRTPWGTSPPHSLPNLNNPYSPSHIYATDIAFSPPTLPTSPLSLSIGYSMQSPRGTLFNPIETRQVKVLLLGGASVGKSSLLLRFTDQQWLPESEAQPTIGVDTWTHKMEVKGKHVNLSIWDTPGEERFRTIISSYYRGTQVIILVYDISNRKSFEVIEWWFAERSKHAPKSAVKVLVGNKADNGHMRQIPTAEATAYAARMGALFVEASAKTAVGVREVFRDTLERVLDSPIPFKPT